MVRGELASVQVQSTTQQLGQICSDGVGEAKRRLEENRPGIDQFVRNIGDNVQQGVKKVQEVRVASLGRGAWSLCLAFDGFLSMLLRWLGPRAKRVDG